MPVLKGARNARESQRAHMQTLVEQEEQERQARLTKHAGYLGRSWSGPAWQKVALGLSRPVQAYSALAPACSALLSAPQRLLRPAQGCPGRLNHARQHFPAWLAAAGAGEAEAQRVGRPGARAVRHAIDAQGAVRSAQGPQEEAGDSCLAGTACTARSDPFG